MSALRLAVIGGVNMDILGTPQGAFTPRDSMIGRVVFRAGGVGRNIAAQAKRLGADVLFVTAFGGDETGRTLKNACEADGLDISRALYTDSKFQQFTSLAGLLLTPERLFGFLPKVSMRMNSYNG